MPTRIFDESDLLRILVLSFLSSLSELMMSVSSRRITNPAFFRDSRGNTDSFFGGP